MSFVTRGEERGYVGSIKENMAKVIFAGTVVVFRRSLILYVF